MIPLSTSVRLLLGLTVLVYAYLVSIGRTVRGTRLVVAVAGLVPVFAWIAAPGLLEAGDLPIGMQLRRLSLVVGGLGIVAGYAAIRAREMSDRTRAAVGAAGTVLLVTAVVGASANWLAGAAAAVSAAAVARISPSEASSRGDHERSEDR